jgi:hypothetical protein
MIRVPILRKTTLKEEKLTYNRLKESVQRRKITLITLYDILYLFFSILIYLGADMWIRSLNYSINTENLRNNILPGGWIVTGLFFPIMAKIIYNIQPRFLSGTVKIFLINLTNHIIVDSFYIIIAIKKQDYEVFPIALLIIALSFIYVLGSFVLGFLISRYLIPLRKS